MDEPILYKFSIRTFPLLMWCKKRKFIDLPNPNHSVEICPKRQQPLDPKNLRNYTTNYKFEPMQYR